MIFCYCFICWKEGVLLDYFIDGGIIWILFYEMDYQKYIFVRYDYIFFFEDVFINII